MSSSAPSSPAILFNVGDPTPPDKSVPLQNEWSFWHDKFQGGNQTAEEYQQSQKQMVSFNTVQKFWVCVHAMPAVPKLQFKSSYHMMKTGIRPVWEDPNNEEGGFWVIRVKLADAAKAWEELILAAIGEQFTTVAEEDDAVNGITVSIRKDNAVLQIWNRKAHPEAETQKILKFATEKVLKGLTTIPSPFYKPCKQHQSYSEDYKNQLKTTVDGK